LSFSKVTLLKHIFSLRKSSLRTLITKSMNFKHFMHIKDIIWVELHKQKDWSWCKWSISALVFLEKLQAHSMKDATLNHHIYSFKLEGFILVIQINSIWRLLKMSLMLILRNLILNTNVSIWRMKELFLFQLMMKVTSKLYKNF